LFIFLASTLWLRITNTILPTNESHLNMGSFDHALIRVIGVCFAAKPPVQHTITMVCSFGEWELLEKSALV
jgi:hypothetical protein